MFDLPIRPITRRRVNLREYAMRTAQEADVSELVTEPVLLREAGRTTVVYLHLLGPIWRQDAMVAALQRMTFDVNHRTTGLPTTSRVFGYEPRKTLRKDFCGATSLAWDDPEGHAALCDGAITAERAYRMTNPTLYAKHRDVVANKVLAEYHLCNTVFTSGIANKNNPLPYHHDRGNFASVWSAMFVFKGAGVEGGHLALPQYDLAFALPDHSLFLFDGQGLLHGVTPIIKTLPDSYRYSVVYYSLRQLWKCQTPAGELARIKRVKTARERKRAGVTP